MRVDRTGGAEDDHRRTVAPGVEDRHGRVHEADVGVQRHGHRLLGHLAVTVGDRDRVLFVQANDHLGITVAEIIDDAVVKAAIAGAGHERDIFEVEPARDFGDDVAAPLHLRFAQIFRLIDLGFVGLPIFRLRHFSDDGCFHCVSLFNIYLFCRNQNFTASLNAFPRAWKSPVPCPRLE